MESSTHYCALALKWGNDLPTLSGLYWFYGWRNSSARDFKHSPELRLVNFHASDNYRSPVINFYDELVYASNGIYGFWLWVDPPTLPELSIENQSE